MNISINSLGVIILVRFNNETVVCMHIFCLVDSMIARAEAPCSIVLLRTMVIEMLRLVLRSWRQGEVHEVSDGRLSLTTINRPHSCSLSSIVVKEAGSLM